METAKKKVNFTRIITGLILFPLVAIILIWGNKYLVDIAIAVIAILSLHEFYSAFKEKANPVKIVGYIAAASIAFIHIIPIDIALKTIGAVLSVSVLVLFLIVIMTNLKVNVVDVAITFFGICYVAIFLMFIPIIRENLPNGRIVLWFVILAGWGTDIFAYFVGKYLGTHKFTEISPNKTIEGCVGGTIGATLLIIAYAAICNNFFGMNINYLLIAGIGILLSIIGQIGDLAASSIKRYVGIKDFSHLIPGHGGMLDRIDSLIFIAPFAYILLHLIYII
jgi:phosphatidate cytidylyltransferase